MHYACLITLTIAYLLAGLAHAVMVLEERRGAEQLDHAFVEGIPDEPPLG